MRNASGYTGETIVDPDNFLAKELKRRGLLDVAVSDHKGYKNGMAQPAVLILKKDGTELYKWAIVPAMVSLTCSFRFTVAWCEHDDYGCGSSADAAIRCR